MLKRCIRNRSRWFLLERGSALNRFGTRNHVAQDYAMQDLKRSTNQRGWLTI